MRTMRWLMLAALASAAGCAARVVEVHHRLPAAVPLGNVSALAPGEVEADAASAAMVSEAVRAAMADRLADCLPQVGGGPSAVVNAEATAELHDQTTTRRLRSRSASGELVTEEVASLVRRAEMQVVFKVLAPEDSQVLAAVETRADYVSTQDPNVWGEWGLERPDEPTRVPAGEAIVFALAQQCVETFCGIVRPLNLSASLEMRPTWTGAAGAGLRAAEEGDYAAAVEHLQQAAARSPHKADLQWNLAVAAEAAGELEKALAAYNQAIALTQGGDAEAVEGARRVRAVLVHHGWRLD